MKSALLVIATALSAVLLAPQEAKACSVVDDYRVPTNLELVEQSSLIVRGRVVGGVEKDNWLDSELIVEPIEALKGELPQGRIAIVGSSIAPDDERGFDLLSNPYQLEGAHPLSYIGGCIRDMFPEGTTALFFLEQRDGAWRPAGGPFSRWAEDVIGDKTPWLELARFYVGVPEEDAAKRKVMLEAERDRLRAQSGDIVAQLMADDIERQLAGPNEPWNAIMRRAIDGEGDIPAGADAEANAAAIAELVDQADEMVDSDSQGYADSMEQADDVMEATGSICFISDDQETAECDGTIYRRADAEKSDLTN